jgi:hypothetical protein
MCENVKPVSAEKSAALAAAFSTLGGDVGNVVAVPGRKLQAGDHLVMISENMARIVEDDE